MNTARAAFLALLLCFSFAAAADVAVPPLSGRVVDQTGTLSSGDIAALTQTLKDLETRKGSQIAVLIVPTTDQESIEQFSIRVAEAWKIGRKKIDDGALLVVAKNDRRLRIEVGYGLEGALTDATARRIIDEDITPKFKSGDFAGGISAGVDRIIRVIDGEKLPAPEPEHWRSPGLLNNIDPFNPFVIAALVVVGGILRSTLGRLFGSLATGGVVGLLAWFLVGSLALSAIFALVAFLLTMFGETIGSSGGRRGGWSGGSGGSSSGGGFSGGGGSFGGGGASGRW
ncbi:MAG: YgcG family protein [Bradyrhizobium sp.]|nr:YgcG family protein [Bradyrhizobium sp.]